VTADQAGTTTYAAAAQVSATINVTAASQSISFGAIPSKVSSDLPFVLGPTASSGLAVVLTSAATDVCTVQNFTVTLIRDGLCTITADQAGNDKYQAAPTVSQSFSVAPGTAAQRIVSIAVGENHACALTDAGGVKCWGFNGHGELGDGTTTDRSTPVDVVGLGGTATAISAGGGRTCALLTSGEIKCWGSNDSGALGDGTTTDSATPVTVATEGLGATKIAVGGTHACAIFVNGETKCWGSNVYGQLGDGIGSNSSTPVTVIELGGAATSIQAGYVNACAKAAGTWKCWGFNIRSYQPLGASQFEVLYSPEVRPQWGFNPTAVSLGQFHSCGLTSANGVKCWGYAAYGQLGDGVNAAVQPIPVDVLGLTSAMSAVSTGSYSSCAVTSAGGTKCWGSGYGPTPTDISGADAGMLAVGAGAGFACGVSYRGGVRCWGSANQFGQLGRNVTASPLAADYVSGLYDGTAFNQTITFVNPGARSFGDAPFALSASASSGLSVSFRSATSSVCTVANGVVTLIDGGVCTIVASQSGNATAVAAPEVAQSFVVTNNPQPQTITNFAPPSSIDSSQKYLTLSATGGASGNPVVFSTSTPDICRVGASAVTILDAGNCVITASQLGNAFFSAAPSITATIVVVPPTTRVPQTLTLYVPGTQVTFYGPTRTQLTIQSDGSVNPILATSTTPTICTVANNLFLDVLAVGTCVISASQAGNGIYAPVQTTFTVNIAVYVPPPPSVVGTALGVGAGHACAVSATGALRCWGANASGQLGDATTSNRSTPVDVVGITTGVVAVAGGGSHTCMLTSAGGVRCWGANDRGQLGNGNNTPSLSPVDVQGLSTGVLDIAVGTAHSCAFMQGGSIKCWGAGTKGSVGDGAGVDRNTPVDVSQVGSGNFDLRAGGEHTCVVGAGGGIKCWGDNSAGQLGDGSSAAFQLLPVAVTGLGGSALGVEVGGLHTCALLADGSVQCWGSNVSGQLGTGDNASQPQPSSVVGLSAGTTSIAVGNSSSCAIVNAGGVKCWGNINSANLASDVYGLDTLTAELGVGGAFACALNANGLVRCWGDNTFGQLGDGTNNAKPYAGAVLGFIEGGAPTKSSQTISFAAIPTTPLGQATVSLIASASSGLPVFISSLDTSVCTVNGNVATLLAAGNCQLVANQSGNTGYFAAPSVSQSFQVTSGAGGQTAQSISGFALPASLNVGSTTTLVASGGGSGNPILFASLTPAVCTVAGNVLTATSVAGLCSVTANQAGNASYAAAPQVTASTTVVLIPQIISGFAPASPIPFVANSTFALSATGGASGNPVVFASTTPAVCSVSGSTVTVLSTGSCVITANQAGNATYAAATQVTATVSVGLASQSITFGALPDAALGAAPLTLTASASSGLPVGFTSLTPTVCTLSGSTVTLLSIGSCVVAADQPGNASFAPAPQVQRAFNVLTGTQTIAFDPLPDRVYGDVPFALVATASSGLPVSFASNSAACVLSGGSVQIVSPGTCTVTASQPGNASFAAAIPVTRTFSITKQNQAITIAPVADQTFGALPIIVAATSTSGLVVSFSTATPLTCTSTGTNGSQISFVGAGLCTVLADQAGTANVNAAPQASLSFNVGKATQTIAFGALSDRGVSDGSVTLAASATSNLAVVFSSTTIGVCTVSGTTVSLLAMGTCSIAADQPGSGNYLPATTVVRSFNVKAAQAINGFSPPATYIFGTSANVALSASATSGLAVRFESLSTDVCVLNGANVIFVGSGICNLAAQQDGSSTYAPAPQVIASIVVLPGQTASAPSIISGAPVPAVKTEPYTKRVLLASNSALSNVIVIGLPPGIDAIWNNQNNIDLSGTPLVSGTYTATIVATNATGTANLPLTIQVLEPMLSATGISSGGGSQTVSCAIYAGGVACWGAGPRGVPADPNATYVPVFAVPPGSNATAVSVGGQQVCAVVAGGLQCWGAYSYQSQGGPLTSVTPASVFPAGSGVTAVAAGAEHTCVVVGGGVQCFGSNLRSQLGNGNYFLPGSTNPVVAIPANSGVTAITSGSYHSCAVVSGAVRCWGSNTNLALGLASVPPSVNTNTSAVPLEVLPTTSFTSAVSASGNRTCALTNGGLTCWGDDSLPNALIAQGGGVTAVSASCAVVNGGLKCFSPTIRDVYAANSGVTETNGLCTSIANKIRCEGSSSIGLASGNASTVSQPSPSVTIPSGSGATAIAVGAGHACAVIAGGVTCWGSNVNKQLGVNSVAASVDPLVAINAGSGATGIAAGGAGSCAVVDGGVKCWGSGVFVDPGTGTYAIAATPATILPARSGVSQVAAGNNQSCAVVSGGIKCWSSFLVGGQSASTPSDVFPSGSGAISVSVSATGGHSCAVVNGGVKCWGANNFGQLGNGSFTSSASPVDAIAAGSGVTAVAAGYGHTCAIINTGVSCWGWNDYSQLGNNSTTSSSVPVVALPPSSGATDITAATGSSCVALAGGVKCWGSVVDNTLGNIAQGANTKIPMQTVAAGSNVISVASGSTPSFTSGQTCALADGGVFCWGVGYSEAVGNRDLYKLNTAVPAPSASTPRAPTITFADPDAGSLILSFTPPSYNGGSGITGYAASCRFLGNVVGTGTAGATATTIRVTGLTNLTNYQCSMRAVNAVGSGEESNTVIGTPAPRYPSRPTITSVTPISGAVVLQFTPPAFTGSGPIVSYQGYCQASGNPAASVYVLGTATSVRVGDLNPGVTYSCTVTASNGYGFNTNSISLPTNVTLAAPVATTVSITSPSNSATFATPAAVNISASASTGPGISISRIDFFVDGLLVGSANTAPYGASWTAVTGTHNITAVAYDSMSGVTTSSPVTVSVTSSAVPTIAITAPTTGASVTLPAPTPVTFATTVPSGKTIDRIEFAAQIGGQSNTVWKGPATGSSTIFDWKPLAAGTYTLIATVIDNEGNAGVSAPVTVTINGAAGETISFMHNDLGGNTIMASDGQGATLWKENYTPFGDRVVKANAAANNRLWFAGKAQDSETGLSYFGARYYDPAIGRFMGIDAAPFSESNLHSFNRYAYGNNNPHRFIDPDGNSALSVLDWKDFAQDVGGLYVNHIIFAVAKINGNEAVAQMAADGLRAGVLDAAISTAGVISPAPGAGSAMRTAVKSEIKAVEIGSKAEKQVGSYTVTFESGMKYHGKGTEARAAKSAAEKEATYADKAVNIDYKAAKNEREAFKDEARRIRSDGGLDKSKQYNKINSPGENYLKQDGK
jgi:RHS repeat-associated protein